METEAEFEVLKWDQIHYITLSQTEIINHNGFKKCVIACLTRDVRITARVLSAILGIPSLTTCELSLTWGLPKRETRQF